ncbi:peptidylprolyl isomerase [Sphingomonas sp.]|uniref:peptidylprolyl isomerase n=1 Tax=Sphingomonas sp. TaxID=28214 RepID=UPI003B3B6E21
MHFPLLPFLLTLVAVSTVAAAQQPAEIVAQAPAGEWRAISPDDLLVMELAPGARGAPRRIVLQLMPAPFAPRHIANIRALARAHWWDGAGINRVQDNYVVQWGEVTAARPLPPGLAVAPASDYAAPAGAVTGSGSMNEGAGMSWQTRDPYAKWVGFYRGWPVASDGRSTWPVHCYGMLGVGRDMAPDTGSGAELYVVIGHAPRHLDRNVALVGRVIEGVEHLSSLPRGTGNLGFYKDAADQVRIRSIRPARDLPEAEQPRFEMLATDGASFARYVAARANRKDDFFIAPAGGVDICNVPVPVRVRAR